MSQLPSHVASYADILEGEAQSTMNQSQAEEEFSEASRLYVDGRYVDALAVLSALDGRFPGNLNILKAKARTLEKLGRIREALAVCDQLLSELGYHKARVMRDRLVARLDEAGDAGPRGLSGSPVVYDAGAPGRDGVVDVLEVAEDSWGTEDDVESGLGGTIDDEAVELREMGDGKSESAAEPPSRFRIKPVRLGLLLLIVVGIYFGYLAWWFGGGLIAAYFLIKFAARRAVHKLFSLPFKMKGKALAGATAELHGFQWTTKPATTAYAHEEEEDAKPSAPLRYVWIDVTITPPVRTQGFTHWEPGELMLAPAKSKIRGLDDMDKCFGIEDVKFVQDGQETDDEGAKVRGPYRLKILAGVPEHETVFKFMYYGECFGELILSAHQPR